MNPNLDLNNWLESVLSPDFFEDMMARIALSFKIESLDKSPAFVILSGVSRGQLSRPPSYFCHSLVVDSTEHEHRHCTGKFKQLLLTCIEGGGLWTWSNTNRFKVRAAAAGMHTVLRIDIHTAGEMILFRFSLSMWALIIWVTHTY